MTIPDAYVKDTCALGAGAATCSYLTFGPDGWACAKGSPLEAMITMRRTVGAMTAMGDNCPGWEEVDR